MTLSETKLYLQNLSTMKTWIEEGGVLVNNVTGLSIKEKDLFLFGVKGLYDDEDEYILNSCKNALKEAGFPDEVIESLQNSEKIKDWIEHQIQETEETTRNTDLEGFLDSVGLKYTLIDNRVYKIRINEDAEGEKVKDYCKNNGLSIEIWETATFLKGKDYIIRNN